MIRVYGTRLPTYSSLKGRLLPQVTLSVIAEICDRYCTSKENAKLNRLLGNEPNQDWSII